VICHQREPRRWNKLSGPLHAGNRKAMLSIPGIRNYWQNIQSWSGWALSIGMGEALWKSAGISDTHQLHSNISLATLQDQAEKR
jgi:hypothetical protein